MIFSRRARVTYAFWVLCFFVRLPFSNIDICLMTPFCSVTQHRLSHEKIKRLKWILSRSIRWNNMFEIRVRHFQLAYSQMEQSVLLSWYWKMNTISQKNSSHSFVEMLIQCYWSIDNITSIYAHIPIDAISNFICTFDAYIKIKNSQNWKWTNKVPEGFKVVQYRWKQNCWQWRANEFFWNGSFHAVWVLSSQLFKENCKIWHEKLCVQMLFISSGYHSFFSVLSFLACSFFTFIRIQKKKN